MKSHPTQRVLTFLCLIAVTFLINFSCSKDEEMWKDAVLNTPTESVEEKPEAVAEDTVMSPEGIVEEEPEIVEDDLTAKVYETRTTVFPPIHDAHLQDDNGYDQNIVRLEENRRVSYLMFDLSPIDSIGGSVNATDLEFTIDTDDGSGTISVFKGTSNDWTEEELSTVTAPEADSLAGQLSASFEVGRTLEVSLDTALIRPEVLTLVLTHEEGNDLAFASKEHPTRKGPALRVTYSAPQDAEAIVFDGEVVVEETPSANSDTDVQEQNTETEETVEEDTTEVETQEAATQEEETSDEDTATEEENTESVDEKTQEDTSTEVEEETQEETSTEETSDQEDQEKTQEDTSTEVEEETQEENTETEEEVTTEETTEQDEEAGTPAQQSTDDEVPTSQEDTTDTEGNPEAEGQETPENAQEITTEEETAEETADQAEEEETPAEQSADDEESTPEEDTNGTEEEETSEPVQEITTEEKTTEETADQAEEEETNNEADAPQNEAPRAVAGASPTSGNAPLQVTFQGGNSSDDLNIEQYVWDFRDGSTSYETNPKHTFEKTGTLEVRLTVTDAQGEAHTDTVTITITEEEKENEAPVAAPKASTASGEAPLDVQFTGDTSTDDTEITSYSWDFKDGSEANTANPSHTFTEAGTYEVVLTVRDEDGLENSRIVTVTVNEAENEEPVALPKASTVSGEAPLEVQFTGDESTDDNEITKYSWDFKDGSFADTANPSHTFNEPGEYKVVLNVEDEQGLSNARIVVVTVTGAENEAPVAKASGSPLSGDAPLNVQFKGSDSTDDLGITGYFWDFKDGSTTTNSNPSHTFNEPGEYDVKLDVRDKDGLTHSTSITVSVTQPASNDGAGDSGSGGSDGGNTGGGDSGSNDNTTNGVKASTFGYNASDATDALKAAINSSYSTIIVDKQSSDWVVETLYLNGIKNKKIIFEQGVVLRAKRGAFRPEDRLFQLVNSENVEIQGYGATFAMNKSEYSGQQNHALSIVNSSNITVKGLTITGAGGDGIYVSRHNDGEYCRNITIDGVTSTKNQRQGMTVISVDGLQIKNSTFSETSGESPGAGIDFEPESTSDRLDNITVTNSTFKNNNGPGIMFAVNKASSSTRPIDATFRNIIVSNNSINNPRLYPTEIDLGMSSDYRTNPVKGTITFDGLRVENSRWSAIYTKKTLESYHVNVKNAVIKNVSKGGTEAAIHIGLLSYGNRSNANMGGFTFENVLIDYDGQAPSLELFGPGHGNWDLGNLKGEIRVRSPRGIRLEDNLNRLSNSSPSVNLRVVED